MADPKPRLVDRLCDLAHWPDPLVVHHEGLDWVLNHILKAVQGVPVRTVVELGCGDGSISKWLGQRFERVIGFDINPNRLKQIDERNVTLLAGSASTPPIRPGSADLILSIALLEHLPCRNETVAALTPLLSENGVMVHVVPNYGWKILQFGLFLPNIIRKQVQSLLRAAAGRKKEKAVKYYVGRESNNPTRVARRSRFRKFYPRIHGEYETHAEEIRAWRPASWEKLFSDAGLVVEKQVPLGLGSPYHFGVSRYARRLFGGRFQCATMFVLRPKAHVNESTLPLSTKVPASTNPTRRAA